MAAGFDAVVLAVSPHARTGIAGLTLVERGRRVVTKLGARRVRVIESTADAADLAAWAADLGDRALIVVQAGDQLVHLPLVAPLLAPPAAADDEGRTARRIAVGPDGAFAGALRAEGADRAAVVAAIVAAPATADRDVAAGWPDATAIPHGAIARHPATTAARRSA